MRRRHSGREILTEGGLILPSTDGVYADSVFPNQKKILCLYHPESAFSAVDQ